MISCRCRGVEWIDMYRDGLTTVLATVVVANQRGVDERVGKIVSIFDKALRRITVINGQFPQDRLYLLLVFHFPSLCYH